MIDDNNDEGDDDDSSNDEEGIKMLLIFIFVFWLFFVGFTLLVLYCDIGSYIFVEVY